MTEDQRQILEMVTHAMGATLAYISVTVITVIAVYHLIKAIYLTYKEYLAKKGLK